MGNFKKTIFQCFSWAIIYTFVFAYTPTFQQTYAEDTFDVSTEIEGAKSGLDLNCENPTTIEEKNACDGIKDQEKSSTGASIMDAIEYILLAAMTTNLAFSKCHIPEHIKEDGKDNFIRRAHTANTTSWLFRASSLLFIIGEIVSLIKAKNISEDIAKYKQELEAKGANMAASQKEFIEKILLLAEEQREIQKDKKTFANIAAVGFTVTAAIETILIGIYGSSGLVKKAAESTQCTTSTTGIALKSNATTCSASNSTSVAKSLSSSLLNCAGETAIEEAKTAAVEEAVGKVGEEAANQLSELVSTGGTAQSLISSAPGLIREIIGKANLSESAKKTLSSCTEKTTEDVIKDNADDVACCATLTAETASVVGSVLAAAQGGVCSALAGLQALGDCQCEVENEFYYTLKMKDMKSELEELQKYTSMEKTKESVQEEYERLEKERYDNLSQEEKEQLKKKEEEARKKEQEAKKECEETKDCEWPKEDEDDDGSIYDSDENCAWRYIDWITRTDLICEPIWGDMLKNAKGKLKGNNKGKKKSAGGKIWNWIKSSVLGGVGSTIVGKAVSDSGQSAPDPKKEIFKSLEIFSELGDSEIETLAMLLENTSNNANAVNIFENYMAYASGQSIHSIPLDRQVHNTKVFNNLNYQMGPLMATMIRLLHKASNLLITNAKANTIKEETPDPEDLPGSQKRSTDVDPEKATQEGSVNEQENSIEDRAENIVNVMMKSPLRRALFYNLSTVMAWRVNSKAKRNIESYDKRIANLNKTLEYLETIEEEEQNPGFSDSMLTQQLGTTVTPDIALSQENSFENFVKPVVNERNKELRSGVPRSFLSIPDFGMAAISSMEQLSGSVNDSTFNNGTLDQNAMQGLLNQARVARERLNESNSFIKDKMGIDVQQASEDFLRNVKSDIYSDMSPEARKAMSNFASKAGFDGSSTDASIGSSSESSSSSSSIASKHPTSKRNKSKRRSKSRKWDFNSKKKKGSNSLFGGDGDDDIEDIDNFEMAKDDISDKKEESIFKMLHIRYLKSYPKLLEEDK